MRAIYRASYRMEREYRYTVCRMLLYTMARWEPLPRGHWHGFWNANEEEAHLMLIVAPGEFGSFFDEVVMNIREENADSPQRIGAIIAETAATRNVTVDMSRLPPEAAALLGPPPAE